MDYSRQHQNINFWRGNQNYSYVTARRETIQKATLNLSPIPENNFQFEPSASTSPTPSGLGQITRPPAGVIIPSPIPGTPVQEDLTIEDENLETMPSTDSGNWGGGGGYGGGGGAAQPSEEEMLIVEDNKIMGLEPKYFYGGLILLAIVGGYMLKTRNTKAKIK